MLQYLKHVKPNEPYKQSTFEYEFCLNRYNFDNT